MSRDPQRLADFLGHIVTAIERIERYTADLDEIAFLDSEIVPGCRGSQFRDHRRGQPQY
jgi:hypothetical protein